MGWEDRDYHRVRGGGSGHGSGVDGLFRVLNWSFPLGTIFDIRVRIHITFILLIIFEVLASQYKLWTARWIGLLFVSVLLHEFGHVLACRKVGGTANDILMWPLGGLAFVSPPRRPWPEFWTTLWGPLVTLGLAAGSYAYLAFRFGYGGFLNPLGIISPHWSLYGMTFSQPALIDELIRDLFIVNWALFLFNMLLLFYPFDGGRLVQEVLWMFIGYPRSMWWATRMGMAGAVLAAGYGVVAANMMLFFIAVFGFIACYQQAQILKHEAIAGEYEEAYYRPTPAKRGFLARRRSQLGRKRALAMERDAANLQAEVDRILDKVRASGLQSLSRGEKKTLQRATEEQRRAG